MHLFKSLSREKSTQDEKMRFIKGNESKLTQIEIISFFIFKSVFKLINNKFYKDSGH